MSLRRPSSAIWIAFAVLAQSISCGGHDAAAPTAVGHTTPQAAADASVDAATPGPDGFTLVIANASLYLDPPGPGDAVGVRGATIAAIGPSQDLAARCNAGCTLVDARSAFVQPGFHDAHVHLYGAGLQAANLHVEGSSWPVIAAAVEGWATAHPNAPWILGRGWSAFHGLPTHAVLDGTNRPVALTDQSGHTLWTNAAAMAVAGIDATTPDPVGGHIVRDANGAPTGIFQDAAQNLVLAKAPPNDEAAIEGFILAGETMSLAAGVTSSEGGPISLQVARVYARLDSEKRLRQRTFLWAPLRVTDDAFAAWVAFARSLPAGGKVQVVAFKGIVDGVMATQSAALLEPYADLPATRGPLYWTASELTPRIIRANQAGFAVALHAIGDRAVRTSLDAFEAARKTVSPSRMNRIEHASLIDEADIPRFAALGVAASVQPIWMTEGWPPALQGPRIGPARTARLYPWRSLADAGTTLLFGSDMPSSEQDDPISGIYGAVARRTQSKVFVPAERVDASLALRAFTSGPAAALGMGDRLGRLAPGHAADVVMLARDPRAGATSIADDPVQQMWIGGTRVTP